MPTHIPSLSCWRKLTVQPAHRLLPVVAPFPRAPSVRFRGIAVVATIRVGEKAPGSVLRRRSATWAPGRLPAPFVLAGMAKPVVAGRRFERRPVRCHDANHAAQRSVVHHRHRGGVPARRPGEPGPSARDAARPVRCRAAGLAGSGGARVPQIADRGRHGRAQYAWAMQGAELADLRATVAQLAAAARARPDRRLHAPLRALEHAGADRARALPGDRPRPRRRRPAPRHLRHARARRHRGRRAAHRPDEPGALFPAAPAHALDLLAVRGRGGHGPQVLSPRRLPGAAAHGPAGALRQLGGVPPDRRPAWCATASSRTPARSGGTCARPRASPRSSCASPTCARASRTPCAWRPCTSASCACSTASAAPTRRGAPIRCSCWPRTAGARSAMASPARCSTSARASWWPSATSSTSCSGCCARTPRRSAAWPEIEHARTIVTRGTSADRQVACFEQLVAQGASREDALKGVVDHLVRETVGGSAAP